MFDLLLKLFPLTSMWLKFATWVCNKSWLYSPLMSSLSLAHHFAVVLKLLWGQGCFNCWSLNSFKFSLILPFFKCCKTKPLQIWSLPPCKTALLPKNFTWQFITASRSTCWSCTVKKNVIEIFDKFHMKTPVLVSF